ncbi:AAA family ATPase [Nostoc sp. UIC 10607]
MLLKTIFIRFYKSFNFDYIKQNDQEPDPSKSWDFIDDKWYPYIEVSIETATKVTTIVGANESGKSHLLSAIEKAISGKSLISGKDAEFEEIKREDFCRYSHFFSIKKGELKFPGFGTEWIDVSQPDQQKIRECCNLPDEITFNSFLLFRVNKNDLNVYIKDKDNYRQYKVAQKYLESISSILPNIFRINSQVALPASIPIRRLINQNKKIQLADNDIIQTKLEIFERQQRNEILKLIENLVENPDSLNEKEGISASQQISKYRDEITSKIVAELTKGKNLLKKQDKRFKLAYDLLCDVSEVDPEILSDLAEALINGKEGYANGIIEMINSRLAERLNFPRWWVQDQEFCLRIAPRDYDLVFTIRDKTGTEYSITERSNGLTYFLSYFIQFLSHKPHPEKNEILLMDEPDAYLSSQAQQDLLKIFDAFSNPQDGSHITRPIQVVYVTHSPFLIDKNHAERIRVLEKGKNDEGTRVVKDIARNHYEPLRSAFGAFVGETTLIGNCNLMVEGAADQILIAGAATYLRNCTETKIETLDLNTVTIVPADSVSQIPYLVYLARGRDVEQPAVIVLLDSNQSGNNAKIQLRKGVPSRKNLLPEEFIIQIAEMQSGITLSHGITLTDLEDLIPLPICV